MIFGERGTKTIISGGIGAPTAFSIQSSQIAFEALSSRLYTDVIRAVIRELACNAYDAHVSVGKQGKPFIITLPTNLDPIFKIRDFGPGMNHEQVLTLYCTYFGSDKTQNNDVIGAFGLGSKSPFAYFLHNGKTGGFAVISYQGGRAKTYAAFIDNGFPKVELQEDFETKEPDGLEVIFPVEQSDVWEFENKAKVALECFDPLPTLNKDLKIARPTYSIKTDRWGLRDNEDTEQGQGVRAIMGTVAYAVGNIDVSKLTEGQRSIFNMPLDIFFKIGEVNPAVSRESLQLDQRTVAAIQKALDDVHTEMLNQIKGKIDAAPTAWEGRIVVWNLMQNSAISAVVNEAFQTGQLAGQYSGFNLSKGKSLAVNELDYTNIEIFRYSKNWSRRKGTRESMFQYTPVERSAARQAVRDKTVNRKNYDQELEVTPNVAVILDDMKYGRAGRYVSYLVQRAADNLDKRTAYLISPVKDAADQKVILAEVSSLLAVMGNPPVILASSLAKKYEEFFPKRKSSPRERGLLYFSECSYGNHHRHSMCAWRDSWKHATPEMLDVPGPKLYVMIEGKYRETHTGINGTSSPSELGKFISHLRKLPEFALGTEVLVYGLRDKSKLLKDPEWVPFSKYVSAVVTTVMNPVREAALSLKLHPFSSDWEFVMRYVAKFHPLPAGSPFQEFSDNLVAARAATEETGDSLAYIINTVRYKVTNSVDFSEIWESVKSSYPLLRFCNKKGYSEGTTMDAQHMVEYLKMIDENNLKTTAPSSLERRRIRKAKNQKAYLERKKAAHVPAQETLPHQDMGVYAGPVIQDYEVSMEIEEEEVTAA